MLMIAFSLEKRINKVIECLQQQFKLTIKDVQEDAKVDVFSYLGVQVTVNWSWMVMFKQQGLIQRFWNTAVWKIATRSGLWPAWYRWEWIQMDNDLMPNGITQQQLECYFIWAWTANWISNMQFINAPGSHTHHNWATSKQSSASVNISRRQRIKVWAFVQWVNSPWTTMRMWTLPVSTV